MTREERNQRNRDKRLLAICLGVIAVWALCLLLSCDANAVRGAAETVAEPDMLTRVLTIIGAIWVSWTLMRVVVWLDTPCGKKK